MPVHHRRLKLIELEIGETSYECQVQNWEIQNNTEDGERHFTFCPDGEFREDADDDYALMLNFFSDWRAPDGLSHFLTENDKELVTFTLNHHPDIEEEHVQWTGQIRVKAPNVGGEVRTEEMTEVTFPIVGKPAYSRPTPP
jgi:hypothetical protein